MPIVDAASPPSSPRGYDKEIVKAMCEAHREKCARDRAMYHAKKASKEVA